MNRITLYEEYRLIERSEAELSSAWKGAHLLLFFLAFVFGSFCTFCFHMLMYLFDEKCVLFPKLLSLTSMRQSILSDFLAENEDLEALPVDFVSTQWVDKSACYLPTYVPLVSAIFGLVWTTMFLMCSSGSRTLTGLQQPWRIIPPVFVFSLSMGCLCTYTSIVTYRGLQELCVKLGEITGSTTCTFAVNVATLAYERRIRGVYQATRLTIFSAWLHTSCWLLAALLALVRILLVIDFRLVRVRAELRGNVDTMLEHHERHLRTISASPDLRVRDKYTNTGQSISSDTSVEITYENKAFKPEPQEQLVHKDSEESIHTIHYVAIEPSSHSEMALVPEEKLKLDTIQSKKRRMAYQILNDVLDRVHISTKGDWSESSLDFSHSEMEESESMIVRQFGQRRLSSRQRGLSVLKSGLSSRRLMGSQEAEQKAMEFRRDFQKKIKVTPQEPLSMQLYESNLNITPEMERVLENKIVRESQPARRKSKTKKSNLKATGNQTENNTRSKGTQQKVHIAESKTHASVSEETLKPLSSDGEKDSQEDDLFVSTEDQVAQTHRQDTQDKETQTPKKEKQD